jgi:FkbH-like protein
MDFFELKKNLKKDYSGFKRLKLAVLADSSTQFLVAALRAYAYEVRVNLEIYEADFGQIDRQIVDTSSEFYQFNPEFVLLFQSTPKILETFGKTSREGAAHFAMDQRQRVADWVGIMGEKGLSAKVIYCNFPEIDDSIFGNFANKWPTSFVYQLRKLNLGLMDLAIESKNLFICDLALLQARFGARATFETRNYVEAGMVFSLDFLPEFAKQVLDIILANIGVFKKCLILDLDNTVWGGVIGDDGLQSIEVGDLGLGKAFCELQAWAKQLKNRGILLAVCSKNNEEIAKEPFEKHPEMVLRLKDISVFVANWDSKVDNINYIKSFLNIGYDSMVFIDDNPFERNVVREHLPDVLVPELPQDPSEYMSYLRSLNLFETSSVTEEDERRTQQFQEESQRVVAQRSFTCEKDFLKSLNMVCESKPFVDFDIPRIAQLIQRSNQFNLRTIRHSEEDVRRIANSNKYFHWSFRLKDKFGDHGLISAVIGIKSGETLYIDTWIMSCRVLKRGVENTVLNSILQVAKENGMREIVGEYISTSKNALVKDHYRDLGFKDVGESRWSLDVPDAKMYEAFIETVRSV